MEGPRTELLRTLINGSSKGNCEEIAGEVHGVVMPGKTSLPSDIKNI